MSVYHLGMPGGQYTSPAYMGLEALQPPDREKTDVLTDEEPADGTVLTEEELQRWLDVEIKRNREQRKPQEEKTARVRLNDKRKMSFKEKREFEQLEKEIAELEAEKAQIEELLCSGTLSVDELTEKSKRLPEVNDLIDEKTMRWLELSEIEG